MNPFEHKPMAILSGIGNFKQIYPKRYCKNETSPYTKTRIILMNGTEFEANWFTHNFQRHTTNNELRRELALDYQSCLIALKAVICTALTAGT